MSGMPWGDWQFWAVSAAALWGAWAVVRQLVPRGDRSAPCGTCASGAAACAKPVRDDADGSRLVVLGDRRGAS